MAGRVGHGVHSACQLCTASEELCYHFWGVQLTNLELRAQSCCLMHFERVGGFAPDLLWYMGLASTNMWWCLHGAGRPNAKRV